MNDQITNVSLTLRRYMLQLNTIDQVDQEIWKGVIEQ